MPPESGGLRMAMIKRSFEPTELYNSLKGKLEEAIREKSYPQVWEIYGEIYMASRLGAISRPKYNELWKMAYPIITRIRLIPDDERSVSI